MQGASWRPLILVLTLFFLGCTGKEPGPIGDKPGQSTDISLQLNWFPEAEHGGFYAAHVHGYFTDEGLEVDILPGGPNSPVIAQVDLGRATFGVVNADKMLMGRDAGADVVSLMAPIQISPRCVMVHEESGIESFDQLRDVTLAVSSGSTFFPFLERQIDLKNVQIVAYSGSVAPFLNDKRYAQQGYVFSEPFVARKGGAKPRSLMVADLGFNPYASTLITTRKTLDRDKRLAQKMTRACQRGWAHYLKDPLETNEYITSLNPEMSLEILNFGAEAIRELCDNGDAPFGAMTSDRWESLAHQMHDAKMLKSPTSKGAFSLEFAK
jgi:NitT/TauT family transport system substrate-binding protein